MGAKQESTSTGAGNADKYWNEYETTWTLLRGALPVMDGVFDAIIVEQWGPDGLGIEFRLKRDAGDQVHQVKGGESRAWTIADLNGAGVLHAFQRHLATPGTTAVFASLVYPRELGALWRKAGNLSGVDQWIADLKQRQPTHLKSLRDAWKTSEEQTHALLNRIDLHTLGDTLAPALLSDALAARVEGATPEQVRGYLRDHLTANRNRPISTNELWSLLRSKGCRHRPDGPDPADSERAFDRASHFARSVHGTRPAGLPDIPRSEVDEILHHLEMGGARIIALTGGAGVGKTTICAQLVDALIARNVIVGALRLDPAYQAATAAELGRQPAIGFGESAARVMRRAAAGAPAVLIIDQFDALSEAAGRGQQVIDGLRETVQEARGVEGLRIVVASRKHDLLNDGSLAAMLKGPAGSDEPVEVLAGNLSDPQVDQALTALGVPLDKVSAQLRALLRNAFNLTLLARILEGREDDLDLRTLRRRVDLLRAYDQRLAVLLRNVLGHNAFTPAVRKIAELISTAGLLSIRASRLDDEPDTLAALLSSGVLVQMGDQIAFFHQSYFEYVYARSHIVAGRTAMDLIQGDPQDLPRRGQVRMILALEREEGSALYLDDLRSMLSDSGVRNHVRVAAVEWLAEVHSPTDEEVDLVLAYASTPGPVRSYERPPSCEVAVPVS